MDSNFFEDDVQTDRLSHHICSCKQPRTMAEAQPPLSAHMFHASLCQARALWKQQGPCWGICSAPLHSLLWAAAHFCLCKRLIKIIIKVVFPSLLHHVPLHKSLSNRPWQENKYILTRGKITDRLLLFWLLLSSHSKWKTRKVASKWPLLSTWQCLLNTCGA